MTQNYINGKMDKRYLFQLGKELAVGIAMVGMLWLSMCIFC